MGDQQAHSYDFMAIASNFGLLSLTAISFANYKRDLTQEAVLLKSGKEMRPLLTLYAWTIRIRFATPQLYHAEDPLI